MLPVLRRNKNLVQKKGKIAVEFMGKVCYSVSVRLWAYYAENLR